MSLSLSLKIIATIYLARLIIISFYGNFSYGCNYFCNFFFTALQYFSRLTLTKNLIVRDSTEVEGLEIMMTHLVKWLMVRKSTLLHGRWRQAAISSIKRDTVAFIALFPA